MRNQTAWTTRCAVVEAAWRDGEERAQVEAVTDGEVNFILVTRTDHRGDGAELHRGELLLDADQAAWLRQALGDALRANFAEVSVLRLVDMSADAPQLSLSLFDSFDAN